MVRGVAHAGLRNMAPLAPHNGSDNLECWQIALKASVTGIPETWRHALSLGKMRSVASVSRAASSVADIVVASTANWARSAGLSSAAPAVNCGSIAGRTAQ